MRCRYLCCNVEPVGYDARSLHTVKLYWQFCAANAAAHWLRCVCFQSELTSNWRTTRHRDSISGCMWSAQWLAAQCYGERNCCAIRPTAARKSRRSHSKEANANKPFRQSNGHFQFSVIVVYCFPLSAHVSQTQSRHTESIYRFATHRYAAKWRYILTTFGIFRCQCELVGEARPMDEIGYAYYVYSMCSGWRFCSVAVS